jgi:hypothetical protein
VALTGLMVKLPHGSFLAGNGGWKIVPLIVFVASSSMPTKE